jgi:hypothetical protein
LKVIKEAVVTPGERPAVAVWPYRMDGHVREFVKRHEGGEETLAEMAKCWDLIRVS